MPRIYPVRQMCSVEDCVTLTVARGFCSKHYQMWQKYGHPEAKHPEFGHATIPARERLEQLSERFGECWLWSFGITKNGYGRISHEGKRRSAHRVSYELFLGPIPEGMTIDHTCHNEAKCAGGLGCLHRRCVNPAHLEAVTMRENLSRSPNWILRERVR